MGKWNFVTANPPFVVETSPLFAPQNPPTHFSTTRFHSPLYPPLNNLTPLKNLFSYKKNAPFLFQLYHLPLSISNLYQSLILPFRNFLPLSSCVLCIFPLSFSLLILYFFPFLSFPYFNFFFRFTVMSRVLLSLLLTLSFHPLISQRHLRTLRGVCTFPALFLHVGFPFPSFISLSSCLAPSKGALNIHMS